MEDALKLLDIKHPRKLIGKDPFKMYDDLCLFMGKKQDPCIIDVFMSVIRFMEGSDAQPWWFFTHERKKLLNSRMKKNMSTQQDSVANNQL